MLTAKYLALFVLLSLAMKASISQKNFSSKDSENLIRASYAGFYNFFSPFLSILIFVAFIVTLLPLYFFLISFFRRYIS